MAGLLAALALLSLPVSHGLALHHVDHHGAWIAAEPDGVRLNGPEAGDGSEDACPLCLVSSSSGSVVLAPVGALPTVSAATTRLSAAPSAWSTGRGDLCVAGPRAPPLA